MLQADAAKCAKITDVFAAGASSAPLADDDDDDRGGDGHYEDAMKVSMDGQWHSRS